MTFDQCMEIARLVLDYMAILIWPFAVMCILFFYKRTILEMLNRIKKADFPGGSVELHDSIREAAKLASEVKKLRPPEGKRDFPVIPLTAANERMIEVGLKPSPSGMDLGSYRIIASRDPNLAVAGLRIELEIMIRNLAKGFNIAVADSESISQMTRKLYDASAITSEQRRLIEKMAAIGNAAVHGKLITYSDAEDIIRVAEILAEQYVSWLGWGFSDAI